MHKRETIYKMGPESVADYLEDLEVRWGVRVALETVMRQGPYGARLLSLVVTVPEEIHRRELDLVPLVSRVLTREAADDFWGVAWGALYDFDCALQGGLAEN